MLVENYQFCEVEHTKAEIKSYQEVEMHEGSRHELVE